jgi:Fe2+ transport system protein B
MSNNSYGEDYLKGLRGTPDNWRSLAIYSEIQAAEELQRQARQRDEENRAAIAKREAEQARIAAEKRTRAEKAAQAAKAQADTAGERARSQSVHGVGTSHGSTKSDTIDAKSILIFAIFMFVLWLLFG